MLQDPYYKAKNDDSVIMPEVLKPYYDAVIEILDNVYDGKLMVENARANNVELTIDKEKQNSKEFKELWNKINKQSYYVVNFDSEELIEKSINTLNSNRFNVQKIEFYVEKAELKSIESKESLIEGKAFGEVVREVNTSYGNKAKIGSSVKYDLIGKIAAETLLTRKDVVAILQRIKKDKFDQFKYNPEEFILKASKLINEEKASVIIQHITYNVLDETYNSNIFTDVTIKGKLGKNAMAVKKHLYDNLVYDSNPEKEFAEELDKDNRVAVYVKLPSKFYISTPVGKYNPDWAIAFNEGYVKHVYFVAETKASDAPTDLRPIEKFKIDCAKKHFAAISNEEVIYDVVDGFDKLLEIVKGNF